MTKMNKPEVKKIVINWTDDDIIKMMSMFATSITVYSMIDKETSEKYDNLFNEVQNGISELDNEADIGMRLAEIVQSNEELYLDEAKIAFPLQVTLCNIRKERRKSNETK